MIIVSPNTSKEVTDRVIMGREDIQSHVFDHFINYAFPSVLTNLKSVVLNVKSWSKWGFIKDTKRTYR